MKMEALAYSNDYVKTLEERGLSDRKFMTRGNGGSTYETNDGFEGSGVVVSPYFTLKINNRETPVYSDVYKRQLQDRELLTHYSQ